MTNLTCVCHCWPCSVVVVVDYMQHLAAVSTATPPPPSPYHTPTPHLPSPHPTWSHFRLTDRGAQLWVKSFLNRSSWCLSMRSWARPKPHLALVSACLWVHAGNGGHRLMVKGSVASMPLSWDVCKYCSVPTPLHSFHCFLFFPLLLCHALLFCVCALKLVYIFFSVPPLANLEMPLVAWETVMRGDSHRLLWSREQPQATSVSPVHPRLHYPTTHPPPTPTLFACHWPRS